MRVIQETVEPPKVKRNHLVENNPLEKNKMNQNFIAVIIDLKSGEITHVPFITKNNAIHYISPFFASHNYSVRVFDREMNKSFFGPDFES